MGTAAGGIPSLLITKIAAEVRYQSCTNIITQSAVMGQFKCCRQLPDRISTKTFDLILLLHEPLPPRESLLDRKIGPEKQPVFQAPVVFYLPGSSAALCSALTFTIRIKHKSSLASNDTGAPMPPDWRWRVKTRASVGDNAPGDTGKGNPGDAVVLPDTRRHCDVCGSKTTI